MDRESSKTKQEDQMESETKFSVDNCGYEVLRDKVNDITYLKVTKTDANGNDRGVLIVLDDKSAAIPAKHQGDEYEKVKLSELFRVD